MNSNSLIFRAFSKIYFSERKIANFYSPFRLIRKIYMRKKLMRLLEDIKYVYLCQFPNIHNDLILSLFQTLTPNSKAKLISVPDAAHVDWLEEKYVNIILCY